MPRAIAAVPLGAEALDVTLVDADAVQVAQSSGDLRTAEVMPSTTAPCSARHPLTAPRYWSGPIWLSGNYLPITKCKATVEIIATIWRRNDAETGGRSTMTSNVRTGGPQLIRED